MVTALLLGGYLMIDILTAEDVMNTDLLPAPTGDAR